MTFRFSAPALAASLLLGACALPLHADVTVKYVDTIDSPELQKALKSATPEMHKRMVAQGLGQPQTSIMYIHGGKLRTDMGPHSQILDVTGHKLFLIDRTTRTYLTSPFNPTQKPPASVPTPNVKVTDTGVTKQFLGHTVRVYKIAVSLASQKQSMNGEVWAAADLPKPPYDPLLNNPGSTYFGETSKVKGYALKLVMHLRSPQGTGTKTQTAVNVSTKPVSANMFAIPAGYKKFTPPAQPAGQLPMPSHP